MMGDAGVFTPIAARYDRMNRILSVGRDLSWRARAFDLVSVDPRSVFDLACGTGDFAFAAAARYPEARVRGGDLTPAMLALAEEKRKGRSEGARVSFGLADASALPDGPAVDLVTCAFGFRNFPDPAAALAGCRRMLQPGGELLVLEFFRPRSRVVGACVSAWLAVASALFASGARREYAHLRRSIGAMLTEEAFAEAARAAGFVLRRRARFAPACTALLFSCGAPQAGLKLKKRVEDRG